MWGLAWPRTAIRACRLIPAFANSGELIAALMPQVLVMHDASDRSQTGACSHKPSRD
jgi:hypothetical protein